MRPYIQRVSTCTCRAGDGFTGGVLVHDVSMAISSQEAPAISPCLPNLIPQKRPSPSQPQAFLSVLWVTLGVLNSTPFLPYPVLF